MLEPTIFDVYNPIDYEINGKIIEVGVGLEIELLVYHPFIPFDTSKLDNIFAQSTPGCDLKDIEFTPLRHLK